MNGPIITGHDLAKEYAVRVRGAGLAGAIRGLFRPTRRMVQALKGISFTIGSGEIVGYLGANGAGKSTTIKILSGILHPSAGHVTVAGLSPQRQRTELAYHIGVVFGQRSQLYWDLRLGESFELMRCMYGVDRGTFATRWNELGELLGVADLVDRPVRQLSLGQRMRAELCAAVLHGPKVLFLDEPTIGLDVSAKQAIRKVVRDLNQKLGTTVILTSHDLREVARICTRIIVIDEGVIVADDSLAALTQKLTPYRLVRVSFDGDATRLDWPGASVVESGPGSMTIRVSTDGPAISKFIAYLADRIAVRDLTVTEPDIEDVVSAFYGREPAAGAPPSNQPPL
jgi:ABC-2 type transport system ATP-binding protein